MIGTYPTPVLELPGLALGGCRIWVKRDDLTNHVYGGSKVRKLEGLLAEAKQKGASRILTIGAVGSHHVLATTIHGVAAGFPVAALLVPQPRTPHVEETIKASLASGLSPIPLRSYASVPWAVVRHRRKTDYWIPLGGSCKLGTQGYRLAAHELAKQVAAGEFPEPEWIVVALGSGGTAAGLAAGLVETPLRSRILAVPVSKPVFALRFILGQKLRELGLDRASYREASARLVVDPAFVGGGYGHPTELGTRATDVGASAGIVLDATYTAKAFAAALALRRTASRVLFWQTLSAPPAASKVPSADLPASVQALLQ